jgi:type II secretory pathway pseudopilin PulG
MPDNNDYYDYQQSLNDTSQFDRFHFFDYVLIFISVISIIAAVVYGIVEQNQTNEITKKNNDIMQVISALDLYYNDSSKVPSERKYPIAVCNGKPNEVDFEYTLKNHLSGKIKALNLYEYIKPVDFPIDTSAEYATRISEKKVKLRDCPKVFGNKKIVDYIYPDRSLSCNFDKDNIDIKYQSCYLYASDNLGFEYKIGYFNQYTNSYIIFSKIRGEPIQKSISQG